MSCNIFKSILVILALSAMGAANAAVVNLANQPDRSVIKYSVYRLGSDHDGHFTLPSLAGGDNYDLKVYGKGWSPWGGIFGSPVHVPDPVPIPAAAWLLLSGLVGVGVMARRRKS